MQQKITMYGTAWCGDCNRAKMFFMDNAIDYDFIDIDTDKKAEEFVLSVNPNGYRSVPVIVIPNGPTLIEPKIDELEKYLKLA
jgi:glutaredoxin